MAENKANQKPKYRFSAEKINQYLLANITFSFSKREKAMPTAIATVADTWVI